MTDGNGREFVGRCEKSEIVLKGKQSQEIAGPSKEHETD